MSGTTKLLSTPLDLGKELQVAKKTVTAAGSETYELGLDAEAVLVSVFVDTTAGDVTVTVDTEGADGHDVEVITFPTISAPTSELLLRKSASVLRKIRIHVTYTDSCTFEIRARGTSSAAASVTIEGSASFQVTQKTATTTTELLIAAALTDRRGLLILNNNVSGTEILNIAETSAKVTAGTEVFPVRPGQNITVDLQAGAEIYAAADTGSVDVKIVEVGG